MRFVFAVVSARYWRSTKERLLSHHPWRNRSLSEVGYASSFFADSCLSWSYPRPVHFRVWGRLSSNISNWMKRWKVVYSRLASLHVLRLHMLRKYRLPSGEGVWQPFIISVKLHTPVTLRTIDSNPGYIERLVRGIHPSSRCNFGMSEHPVRLVVASSSHLPSKNHFFPSASPYLILVPKAVPSLVVILCVWLLPESPRWLVANSRDAEALAFLTRFHGNGDPQNPVVALEWYVFRIYHVTLKVWEGY